MNASKIRLTAVGILAIQATGYAQMPAVRVVVVEAEMRKAAATITLVGTVRAARRSRIGSEIAGIVADMPVRQGDFVKAGEVLCKLRDDNLALRLAEAKASLGSIQARHQELISGTRREELVRLQAVLDEARAEDERWKFEMQRIEKLYEGKVSNAKEFQDTRADYLAAERRRIAAQASYDLGLEGPRPEVLAQAEYDVAEQQAVVDRIAVDLARTTIRAPFDGYVLGLASEVGEWITVGGTVLEIVDLSSVLVGVNVPESALAYAKVDQAVRVWVDALGRSFPGRIKHVVRQADERARTFPLEIEIDNSDRLLAGGMFARATIPAGPATDKVAVPKDAIVERGGIASVAKVVPGEHGGTVGILVAVTVGTDVGDWITITSNNIRAGMKVVTRGNERLLPFPTPVVVVTEDGVPVSAPGGENATSRRGDH